MASDTTHGSIVAMTLTDDHAWRGDAIKDAPRLKLSPSVRFSGRARAAQRTARSEPLAGESEPVDIHEIGRLTAAESQVDVVSPGES